MPKAIVKEMERITAAGFAGTTLSFVDYVKEISLLFATK